MITCGGCPETWTGTKMAHCAGCHNTFTTVTNFDRHRKNGICNAPESVGLVRGARGHWMMPGVKTVEAG